MTRHYNANIKSINTILKLTYRNRRFVKMELVRGKLTGEHLKAVGKIIPEYEASFEVYNKRFLHVVDYSVVVKEKSLYQQFVDLWYEFYEAYTDGLKPKFTGADGKHLKQIIVYLKKLSKDEQEALQLWEVILDNWPSLDKFHQVNTDLKYINSRMNVILTAIKKLDQTKKTTGGDAVTL